MIFKLFQTTSKSILHTLEMKKDWAFVDFCAMNKLSFPLIFRLNLYHEGIKLTLSAVRMLCVFWAMERRSASCGTLEPAPVEVMGLGGCGSMGSLPWSLVGELSSPVDLERGLDRPLPSATPSTDAFSRLRAAATKANTLFRDFSRATDIKPKTSSSC